VEWQAPMDPEAKVAWVEAARARGRRVVFAGDGLNDGPALARADVGIAMGSGSASSVLIADGLVATDSLSPILAGIRAGRAADRIVRWSQSRAIGYNLIAVAAAVAGLINPLVAAILMPLSSGLVIWSASRVEPMVREAERCER